MGRRDSEGYTGGLRCTERQMRDGPPKGWCSECHGVGNGRRDGPTLEPGLPPRVIFRRQYPVPAHGPRTLTCTRAFARIRSRRRLTLGFLPCCRSHRAVASAPLYAIESAARLRRLRVTRDGAPPRPQSGSDRPAHSLDRRSTVAVTTKLPQNLKHELVQ